MHINDFPYEILCKVLEVAAQANTREGPTYTFGLSQAPLLLQRVSLHRYVKGLIAPQKLKWDATSPIRCVCHKWHEWALEYALKDVYVQRKGGEVRTAYNPTLITPIHEQHAEVGRAL